MRLLRYSILPLLILGLWWLVTRGGAIPAILLPPPADVGRAALELFSSGEGFRHAGTSLLRVFAGYGISSLAALTLAAVLARSPNSKRALTSFWSRFASCRPCPSFRF